MANEESPVVSVVLPYFNGEEFLEDALTSVRAQTFEKFEVLVIDDGSSDETQSQYAKDLICSLSDNRFRYHYKVNGGLSDARNFGIENGRGRYICFLDQDDTWAESKLEKQVEILEQCSEADLVFTDGLRIGDVESRLDCAKQFRLSDGLLERPFEKMLKGNFIPCSSVMFRRDLVDRGGMSNRYFASCPDYELFIRFSQVGGFFFLDQPLLNYRIHAKNTTKNVPRLNLEFIIVLFSQRLDSFGQRIIATKSMVKAVCWVVSFWLKKLVSFHSS